MLSTCGLTDLGNERFQSIDTWTPNQMCYHNMDNQVVPATVYDITYDDMPLLVPDILDAYDNNIVILEFVLNARAKLDEFQAQLDALERLVMSSSAGVSGR